MFGLGTWEMVIIVVAALIFIGPGKLPELAKTLGKGMREMRRAMAGFETEARSAVAMPSEEPNETESEVPADLEAAGSDEAKKVKEGKSEPSDPGTATATATATENAPPTTAAASDAPMPKYGAPEGPRVAAGRPGPAPANADPEAKTEAEADAKADKPAETG
jgi:TatA/E family protein of Tat protein translocase